MHSGALVPTIWSFNLTMITDTAYQDSERTTTNHPPLAQNRQQVLELLQPALATVYLEAEGQHRTVHLVAALDRLPRTTPLPGSVQTILPAVPSVNLHSQLALLAAEPQPTPASGPIAQILASEVLLLPALEPQRILASAVPTLRTSRTRAQAVLRFRLIKKRMVLAVL